jgi:predicted enzyme related to lactoylglutathione lyase
MPERDGYIPGVPCWIDTSQPDPKAAVDFYRGLLGWVFAAVMPAGSQGSYFIGLHGGDVASGSIVRRRVWRCGTIRLGRQRRRTAAKCAGGGASSTVRRHERRTRSRPTEPEGAGLCVWQAKVHKGAQSSTRGLINFNGLNTRDAEGASRSPPCSAGDLGLGGGAEMWTLPGYGDYLDATTPTYASRWPKSAARRDSRTWLRAST